MLKCRYFYRKDLFFVILSTRDDSLNKGSPNTLLLYISNPQPYQHLLSQKSYDRLPLWKSDVEKSRQGNIEGYRASLKTGKNGFRNEREVVW